MRTTAGIALTSRFEIQIVKAFRGEQAVSASRAQRLRDLGLKDSLVLRGLISSAVIRKAGPERFFLDEDVWASRRHAPVWYLALVVLGVLAVVALGAVFLSR